MAKISHSQMAKLFRRLATSYTAGLDIRSIYERETKSGSSIYRLKANIVLRALSEGITLADSMRKTDGYYPELAVSVVQAGEMGGRMDESFKRLANHYDSIVKFRNAFLLSIAWPAFELFFAVGFIGLMILIMGWVCETANIAHIDWLSMGLSPWGYFALYWTVVLTITGTLFFLTLGTLKGWFGTMPMRLARRTPLIGTTIESMALSRFAWTMSVSENAGMRPTQMARLSIGATQNYYYDRLVEPLCNALQAGQAFYPSMKATESFPEDFLMHVENGEIAGELAETMDRVSADHQTRAENNLKLIGTIGFVCTLLFVGLVVGCAVIYMYQKLVLDTYKQFLTISGFDFMSFIGF